jgi:uncharacterized protein (DUF924 family)
MNEEIALTDADRQSIEQICSYWFGENISTWSKTYPLKTKVWFKVQERVDREIKKKFEQVLIDVARANSVLYQRWQTTDQGKVALILLLDQFPRNIYRGTSAMFAFESLSVPLASKIIDDPLHVKHFSLPERLFLYLSLVHTEELVSTTKGATLLEELVSEVSQRDVRRRYATAARSARSHQQVIELFGRDPDRNAPLGRESTPEEVEYLQAPHQGPVRAVPKAPPTRVAIDGISPVSLLRILVLHGFQQNSNSLKRSAKKVFRDLKGLAMFYFANAPLPYNPSGEVKEQLVSAFGDGNMPEASYQRQWYTCSKDSKIYHHIDVSLHYLDQLFKSDGSFDGVLGFSVGLFSRLLADFDLLFV